MGLAGNFWLFFTQRQGGIGGALAYKMAFDPRPAMEIILAGESEVSSSSVD
jgi:hypothetical protein